MSGLGKRQAENQSERAAKRARTEAAVTSISAAEVDNAMNAAVVAAQLQNISTLFLSAESNTPRTRMLTCREEAGRAFRQ